LSGARLLRRGVWAMVSRQRRRECVAWRSHRRHEDLTAPVIGKFQRRPRVVDEQLLAGPVLLAHRAAQRLRVGLVVLAELRQAPGAPPLIGRTLLLPQQRQHHALAAQFQAHPPEVGLDHTALLGAGTEQPSLDFSLTEGGNHATVLDAGSRQRHVLGRP